METKTDKQVKPAFMKKREVLRLVNLSYPTIWQLMREGKFPLALDITPQNMWDREAVEDWVEEQRKNPRPVKPLDVDN